MLRRAPTRALAIAALVLAACSSDRSLAPTTEPPPSSVMVPANDSTTTTVPPDPCPDVFCVIYHLHPEALWSDGVPVTADDVAHTYELISDPRSGASGADAYQLITGYEIVDEKTILFAFSSVFGPWPTLFDVVLPAHAMDGLSFEEGLAEALETTSGPFTLDERLDDDRLLLERNARYWSDSDRVSGADLGDVEAIEFVVSDSLRDMVTALEAGEIDVINPRPPTWMIQEVSDLPDVAYAIGPGEFWEHVDFNHDDTLLSQKWVREAISLAIDRKTIVAQTVGAVDPQALGLGNTLYMTNSANYQAHYYDRFDPEAARAILEENSCELGEDDVYSCQGRRLSFVWATTFGDEYRQTQFELARESLSSAGIEVVGDFMTPSELFSSDVFFAGPDRWQLINFSWKAAADPYLGETIYLCRGDAPSGFGELNVNRYCDPDVESLIKEADGVLDPAERAALFNRADRLYLDGLALIPLYQKPAFMAWSADLSGPELNPSRSTDFWNVAAWSGPETVVVALEEPPGSLNPLAPSGDSSALVLKTLFHGLFEVDQHLQFKPVLLERAETIVTES